MEDLAWWIEILFAGLALGTVITCVAVGLHELFFGPILISEPKTIHKEFPMKPVFDASKIQADGQAQCDAAYAAGQADQAAADAVPPPAGVSADQEAADIAEAVAAAAKPLQDQIAALQADDDAKAALAASAQALLDKVKALLA